MAKAKRTIERDKQTQTQNRKTPLFLMLSGAVILIIAAFFAFQKKPVPFTPEVAGSPSLKTDKEEVNLGDIKLAKTVNVSFNLQNIGDQPLQFSEVPYIYFQTSTIKKISTISYCMALMGDSHSCYDERVRPTNCDHLAIYGMGI